MLLQWLVVKHVLLTTRSHILKLIAGLTSAAWRQWNDHILDVDRHLATPV
jgi:hypothetical protein